MRPMRGFHSPGSGNRPTSRIALPSQRGCGPFACLESWCWRLPSVRSGKHKENHAIAGEANHPVIIHTSAAYRGDMGVYIDALGTVTPISTINVFSQVSSQVLAVHYA